MRYKWIWGAVVLAAVLPLACDDDKVKEVCEGNNCDKEVCKGHKDCPEVCKGDECLLVCGGDNCDKAACKDHKDCKKDCDCEPEAEGEPWTQADFTDEEMAAAVAKLKERKVFFARKSVGWDLTEGISRNGISMRSVDFNHDDNPASHSSLAYAIGQLENGPAFIRYDMISSGTALEKFNVFKNSMTDTVEDKVDIAFMKLCYVNFSSYMREGEAEEIFTSYQQTIKGLEERFPSVAFVHITTPLYSEDAAYNNSNHNNVIERFNARMRTTYGAQVFDLAKLESIRPGGTGTALSANGQSISLAREWARDTDGHLNPNGQARFGGALLAFLAQVGTDKPPCVCAAK